MQAFKIIIVLFPFLFFIETKAQQLSDTCIDNIEPVLNSSSYNTQLDSPCYYRYVSNNEIHQVKSNRQPVWLFIILAFQLGLLAYLRVFFPKGFEDMIKALFSLTMAHQQYRDQQMTMPVSAILYSINFVCSVGIFLFLLNDHYCWMTNDSAFVSMLFFLWVVIVLYSFKYGSMKLVSIIFPFGGVVNHYNFNFFLVQKVLGLVLIPLNLLIAYSPEYLQWPLIIITFVLIAGFVIIGSWRGLEISRNLLQHDTFHFFIYICTLEIAPVCILVKVVEEWLG